MRVCRSSPRCWVDLETQTSNGEMFGSHHVLTCHRMSKKSRCWIVGRLDGQFALLTVRTSLGRHIITIRSDLAAEILSTPFYHHHCHPTESNSPLKSSLQPCLPPIHRAMAPSGGVWSRDSDVAKNQHTEQHHRATFAPPALNSRPKLFCCPVAESNPGHLPRSFVNPGRHLMNLQLRTFLECADDADFTFSRCEVSHIVEVTTRTIRNLTTPNFTGQLLHGLEQWNVPASMNMSHTVMTTTPPLEEDAEEHKMMLDNAEDKYEANGPEIPYSTYQSMSTRFFIPVSSNNAWQVPPHSRHYRDNHADAYQGRGGVEKYMEIPPFTLMPLTVEWSSGGSSGPGGGAARPWGPSCSLLMWCTTHNNFYEVHIMS